LRSYERADESVLSANISAWAAFNLSQPKIKTLLIGIAPEVGKVFHEYKCRVVLTVNEHLILGNLS